MIRYSLRCPRSHDFDSWFQSAEAFASLQLAGHLACPICGDSDISKTLMSPAVRPASTAGEGAKKPALTEPANDIEAAFAEMRRQVEANSEYVGLNFVTEARRMHEGSIDERSIYGEAKPEEARALLDDGVPVAPLPFMPTRKAN
jgi:hypothetical protein